MPHCETCWTRFGRDLYQGCCICTGDVGLPSAFHEWNGKRLVKLPERALDAPKEQERVFKAPRLVFGTQIIKEKKR